MPPTTNVKVVYLLDNDSKVWYFRDVPMGISNDQLKEKIRSMFVLEAEGIWEIEKNIEFPYHCHDIWNWKGL